MIPSARVAPACPSGVEHRRSDLRWYFSQFLGAQIYTIIGDCIKAISDKAATALVQLDERPARGRLPGRWDPRARRVLRWWDVGGRHRSRARRLRSRAVPWRPRGCSQYLNLRGSPGLVDGASHRAGTMGQFARANRREPDCSAGSP